MMTAELETRGKNKVALHYANTDTPHAFKEIEEHFHDHTDIQIAEVFQDQESLYQSFQKNTCHDDAEGSSGTTSTSENKVGQFGSSTCTRNSTESANIKSQLELDEAIARALQEDENPPEVATFPSSSKSGSMETSTSSQATLGDDVNIDNMSYEELQSLGETIGAESKGLSDELIGYLQTSTYKVGLFSKKKKHNECVICCMPYKNGDKLINLPCNHQYHSGCITRWLKIKKACPVCKEDVFG